MHPAPLRGARTPGLLGGVGLASDAEGAQLLVDVVEHLIEVLGVPSGLLGGVPVGLHVGTEGDQPPLLVGRLVRLEPGSSSRCQPTRHCAIGSRLRRSAQDGQLLANVAPQGTSITAASPVSRSIRRTAIGRVQTP